MARHDVLSPQQAAELQGFDNLLVETIMKHQPGWLRSNNTYDGVTQKSREVIATHMIGNGVPFALGRYVAEWIAISIYGAKSATISQQLPLFLSAGD